MPQQAEERATRPPLWHARVLIGQGRCEEALLQLSYAVRQFPEWAEPWVLVAQSLSLKCRYADALSAIDEALALEPGHIWAQELRTGLLLQLQRRAEALRSAERLVGMSPNRAESHAFLAFAEAFLGRERQALAAARKCRKLAPESAYGHQAFCVVHLAFKRWEKAEHSARAAIAIDSSSASVFHDLGIAQFEQGKIQPARQAMATAAKLDPRFTGALHRLEKRTPHGVSPLPVFIAMAAGIAAVPAGRMPILFAVVVAIGVASLVLAARRTGKSMTLHPDRLKPALVAVLAVDAFVVAQHLGLFGL